MSNTFEADMAYLMAELAQAQQLGVTTAIVRVTELQSILDRMRNLMKQPTSEVRVCGYARPGEVDQMRRGKIMTMRVRRQPSEWHTQLVFNQTAGETS
jgi:hypothetical protein